MEYLLINSILTEDQRQAVLASFARLGTKRLRPVFDDLNGAIPYDELKLCLLHYLSQDQNHPEDQESFLYASLSSHVLQDPGEAESLWQRHHRCRK